MPGESMTALVAGATGAVGTALTSRLATRRRWTVLGLSRRPPKSPIPDVSHVTGDLADPCSCAAALSKHPPVTHIFYCARVTHSDEPVESVSENLLLLEGVIEAADRRSGELRHVHIVQGGKYYGVHLGPFPTPAREDQDRCAEQNFYHAQEDFLRGQFDVRLV
ncbi:MAG: NAD-dependent epimerase/dehydratase family protein [Bryobacterales bacterium]|nr:NAD-dependent epimerase/dehydratase family protein [Bryobacterales bacterium]